VIRAQDALFSICATKYGCLISVASLETVSAPDRVIYTKGTLPSLCSLAAYLPLYQTIVNETSKPGHLGYQSHRPVNRFGQVLYEMHLAYRECVADDYSFHYITADLVFQYLVQIPTSF